MAPLEETRETLKTLSSHVDTDTFCQILEMDDNEDNREFSKGIFNDYRVKSGQMLVEMRDLMGINGVDYNKSPEEEVEPLQHGTLDINGKLERVCGCAKHMKGGSRSMGFIRVGDILNTIEYNAQRKDEDDKPLSGSEEELLERIRKSLAKLEDEYRLVTKLVDSLVYRDHDEQ